MRPNGRNGRLNPPPRAPTPSPTHFWMPDPWSGTHQVHFPHQVQRHGHALTWLHREMGRESTAPGLPRGSSSASTNTYRKRCESSYSRIAASTPPSVRCNWWRCPRLPVTSISLLRCPYISSWGVTSLGLGSNSGPHGSGTSSKRTCARMVAQDHYVPGARAPMPNGGTT